MIALFVCRSDIEALIVQPTEGVGLYTGIYCTLWLSIVNTKGCWCYFQICRWQPWVSYHWRVWRESEVTRSWRKRRRRRKQKGKRMVKNISGLEAKILIKFCLFPVDRNCVVASFNSLKASAEYVHTFAWPISIASTCYCPSWHGRPHGRAREVPYPPSPGRPK